MKEDPTRDPASEARDDHASEPRATPETDAMETVWNDLGVMVVASGFSRRLERQRDELTDRWEKSANAFLIEQGRREAVERQRDELMEALEDIAFGAVIKRASGGCGQRQLLSAAQMSRHAESAIAAAKGGTP